MSDMQFGHDGRHHGCGTPECPTELHHHHDERCASPLEERRQRAREAYEDAVTESAHVAGWPTSASWSERATAAREAAIETATRVRITDDIVAEFYPGMLPRDAGRAEACLRNGLRALGFEVEE